MADAKDLVERLRLLADTAHRDPSLIGEALDIFGPLYIEAADEIERLRVVIDAAEAVAKYDRSHQWDGTPRGWWPDTQPVNTAVLRSLTDALERRAPLRAS